MLHHEREFFVYRLIAGYIPYGDVRVYYPSIDSEYAAQQLYIESYNSAVTKGCFTSKTVVDFLIKIGTWNQKLEFEWNTIPKHIDQFKVELYENRDQSKKLETIRKYLAKARERLGELSEIRHSYDHLTAEGVAQYNRLYALIERSVYKDDKPYLFDSKTVHEITTFYTASQITDEQARELARTEPWQGIWAAHKKLNSSPFSFLNDERRRVIMWSSLYDNIREYPDYPETVVEDDDMLDGWLILKRREREKEQGKQTIESELNPTIAGAAEVFVCMKDGMSDEDKAKRIKAVEELNDVQGKIIKAQRKKQLEAKGEVDERQLSDVNREIQMNSVGRK